jgi:anti-sigma B factor antagonist
MIGDYQTMPLEVDEIQDVVVIKPTDEITPLLSYRMEAYVRLGKTRFVIDLQKFPSIGSLEIGLLVSALKRARGAGGDLKLAAVRPMVKTILGWASLNKILEIYETKEEAVKSFGVN